MAHNNSFKPTNNRCAVICGLTPTLERKIMLRALILSGLLAICGGCTTTVIAAREGINRPNRVFKSAIKFDLQCMALPFAVLSSGPSEDSVIEDPRIGLVVLGSAFAYGAIDIPFTYSAYSLYRAKDYAQDKYEDFKSR